MCRLFFREYFNFSNSHVVVRTVDTAKAEDLEKTSVKDARTVLVMSPAAAVARARHVLLAMHGLKWPRYGTCVVESSSRIIVLILASMIMCSAFNPSSVQEVSLSGRCCEALLAMWRWASGSPVGPPF